MFWDDGQGQSFFLTVGTTLENRHGGTQPGAVLPVTGLPYPEGLQTRRFDVGMLWQMLAARRYVVTARATTARQWHDHQFGELREHDRHSTDFAEVTLRGSSGAHTWVGGVAVEQDAYDPTDLRHFAYTYTTPGVFVQDDIDIRPWLAFSMSGRLDHHSEYGTFFSPRVSALLRSGNWSTRISTGSGFFGPSVLTEETVAAGLTRLKVEGPLRAERGRSVSIDLTRTHGPFSHTATFFGSRIAHPIKVDRPTYVLQNLVEPTTNMGVELLGLFRRSPLAITASYTYVHSREREGGVTHDVELTPRHSTGLVGMWENENGRVGVEWYYTGRQRLEDNSYRGTSESYNIIGLLIERRVGPLRLFVNGENLTDTSQEAHAMPSGRSPVKGGRLIYTLTAQPPPVDQLSARPPVAPSSHGSVVDGNAQQSTTEGWVFGFDLGGAAVSVENKPSDGAGLVGARVGYGLNRILTVYLSAYEADVDVLGFDAFDKVTFSHVDLGVRLHLANRRRRWVPSARGESRSY